MQSICEAVYVISRENPDKLAIVCKEKEVSYGELWDTVERLAYVLCDSYSCVGQRVLVQCSQDEVFLELALACQLMGAVFVPIEKRATKEEYLRILQDTEAMLSIVVSEELKAASEIVQTVDMKTVFGMLSEKYKGELPRGESMAEILYTTGTTGTSKGIMISNAANIALAQNIVQGVLMEASGVDYVPLPLSHSHALRECYANFYRGSTVLISDGVLQMGDILESMRRYKVTSWDISPSAFVAMYKLTRGAITEFAKTLQFIQIGTTKLSEEVAVQLLEQFGNVRLYNTYGSTESGRSCLYQMNNGPLRRNCIGIPTVNATFITVDEKGQVMQSSLEHPGLLACRGPMNMMGYWKQPELTRKTLIEGYVYTNDLSYIDSEGYVYVLGRAGDVIDYKGIKIVPEEIETIVNRFPTVKESVCVPVADEVAGQVPKIYLVVEPEGFDRNLFLKYMEENIDLQRRPKYIELIESVPRTSNGKILRKELR